ncbi:hypothetical protein CF336_g6876 [Tilletia laevis]|nr:hypothetical protein CF328_g7269 [Tilletia controversa]KAE8186697.1 hypothetical protein CF336_g6876 [Tilletia laevis]
MLYPRLLFLLPYLFLLLAVAANSAPVLDAKGCTSCPNLPRTLGWFSNAVKVVDETAARNARAYAEWLALRKDIVQNELQRAQDELRRIKHEGSSEDRLTIADRKGRIKYLKGKIDEYQQRLNELRF